MNTITPRAAIQTFSSLRDINTPAARQAQRVSNVDATPASSTKVTLAGAPSADYTDMLSRRARVGIEAALAGAGRLFHTGAVSAGTAPTQLTYSFAPQAGMPLSSGADASQGDNQQAAIRDALVYLSSMINVRFVEVAIGGQISIASAVPAGGDSAANSPAPAPAPAAPAANSPPAAGSPAVAVAAAKPAGAVSAVSEVQAPTPIPAPMAAQPAVALPAPAVAAPMVATPAVAAPPPATRVAPTVTGLTAL